MKAWQRQIREAKAEGGGDLYGRWWDGIEADIATATIEEIDPLMAEKVILEYEWLGSMPAIVLHCYGIFFKGICGGVAVYSPEYAENLGVWDKYGYTRKIITLARGACVHWAHPHAASKLTRGSMALLPAKYEVVTATTDSAAGEIGTIYQACGFSYVGQMSAGGKRAEMIAPNGEKLSGRHCVRFAGTRGVDKLRAAGFTVNAADRKARYFAFRGDARTKRAHLKAIAHLVKPYPKRRSSEASAASHVEAGFDPSAPLQTIFAWCDDCGHKFEDDRYGECQRCGSTRLLGPNYQAV